MESIKGLLLVLNPHTNWTHSLTNDRGSCWIPESYTPRQGLTHVLFHVFSEDAASAAPLGESL